MFQSSQNKGHEFLIPAYNLFDFGLFATASKSYFRRVHVSGGIRFDTRSLHSHSLIDDGKERFTAFSRAFSGLTGSVGAAYNVFDQLNLRLNIARGFRAPNLSELGSNGIHEGTFRYETGNTGLRQEYSTQADFGVDYASKYLSFQVSLFANRISNYIFLQRCDGTAIDGLPVYRYTSGDARLLGGEARLIIHPLKHLHFENSFSYVNAVLLNQPTSGRYLPFTPAPHWLSTLHYDIQTNCKSINAMFVEIEADCNFRQDHVYEVNDTETPTPSYVLFNISAGTDIMWHGNKLCSVCFTADNIFNRTYQNHLSRLKYADVNTVTGKRGVFNMGRNIGIKILFPIEW